MKNRAAIFLAILCLAVIVLGAYFTGETRPMPGSDPTQDVATVSAPALKHVHRIAGYVLAAGVLGLAIWVANMAGWIALAAAIAEAFSGGAPFLHALTAPALFTAIVAVAVVTSRKWQAEPNLVICDWKPLNILCMLLPVLVVMQIGLGAAFRHNDMGVISHIMNAMIVLAVVLIAGVFVVRQYPEHPSLKPAALWLLIIAGVQVTLGFAVYLVLLISQENNMGLVITGVLHVVNGALTLAASVVLAMQMKRHLIQSSGAK
jgi:heme A synthase